MSINLSKGQKIDLTKGNENLKKLHIGLGWDTNKYDGGKDFDLDVSVFLLDVNQKVAKERNFIFFNNLTDEASSVKHSGDNRTGTGTGDDEVIYVELDKVPADVERISFIITIYEAQTRNQNFGQVTNSYVRVANDDTQQELMKFDLGEDFSVETAVVACELYRHSGEWKFHAVGSGYQGGLDSFCRQYGLNV